jgi:hypothetical protein
MKESEVFQEFQQEARVETCREDILLVLEARFGRRAAGEFAPFLKTVTKMARLNRLLRLAARAAALEQFREGLSDT